MGRFKHVAGTALLAVGGGAALGWAAAPAQGDDPPVTAVVSSLPEREERLADVHPEVSAATSEGRPSAGLSAQELQALEAQTMNMETGEAQLSEGMRSLLENAERIERESGYLPPPPRSVDGGGKPRHIEVRVPPTQSERRAAEYIAEAEEQIRRLEEAAEASLSEAERAVRQSEQAVHEAERQTR